MTQPVAQREYKPTRVLSRRIFIIVLLVVGIAALAVSALRRVSRQETAVSPEQNVQQGLALNKQQQYNAAIDEFTQAIKARSDMVDAYLYRGIALFGAGRPKESITDFSKVLELRSLTHPCPLNENLNIASGSLKCDLDTFRICVILTFRGQTYDKGQMAGSL
jgi:tetratricopeptide (TPR) repeat protein